MMIMKQTSDMSPFHRTRVAFPALSHSRCRGLMAICGKAGPFG